MDLGVSLGLGINTDPQGLWHIIIILWDPQMTSKIPNHISVFIILF